MSRDSKMSNYYEGLEYIRVKYLVGNNNEYFIKKKNFLEFCNPRNITTNDFWKYNNEYFDIQNKVLELASYENKLKFKKIHFLGNMDCVNIKTIKTGIDIKEAEKFLIANNLDIKLTIDDIRNKKGTLKDYKYKKSDFNHFCNSLYPRYKKLIAFIIGFIIFIIISGLLLVVYFQIIHKI